MTRMKSKKMTKSTFAIIIMAVAMVAMLAFGGTYAYFTAQAQKATGNVTTAVISLKNATNALSMSANANNVVPGDTITATFTLDNTGTTVDTWVFMDLTYAAKTFATGFDESKLDEHTKFTLDTVTVKNKTAGANDAAIAFNKIGETGNVYGSTEVVTSAVTTLEVTLTFKFEADVVNMNGAGVAEMGTTYEVTAIAGSIQKINDKTGAALTQATAWEAFSASKGAFPAA